MSQESNMNANYTPKVNIDYITAVIERNGRLERQDFKTGLPRGTVKKLKEMFLCDEDSLIDMQNEARGVLPEAVQRSFDYLAPIKYADAYVLNACYPISLSKKEYEQKLVDAEKQADEQLMESLVKKYPEDKDLKKREEEYDKEVKDVRQKARTKQEVKLKEKYFYNMRQYLCAWYYDKTKKAHIDGQENVKMYSTDTHGWTNFTYPISKDVEIGIHTNFGYGCASYFCLELKYQGIPIVPYSFYVIYYYANSREIARYTRMYKVERENWLCAFEFVEETVNLAMKNPVQFVQEWVMNEVQKMIQGLREIMRDPQRYVSHWLDKTFFPTRYLFVEEMDDKARSYYKVYPREMTIDFKVGKIAGAFDFLESLTSLKLIYQEVSAVIDEIKLLGRTIMPEIVVALKEIKADIKGKEELLVAWRQRRERLENRIKTFEIECENLIASQSVKVHRGWLEYHTFKARIIAEYNHSHPEYERCQKVKQLYLQGELRTEKDIRMRKQFQDKLEGYQEKIKSSSIL